MGRSSGSAQESKIMTIDDLDIKTTFNMADWGRVDEALLTPGWYWYVGSGGGILVEKRGDGSIRHAMVGSAQPTNVDVGIYFRTEHNWFE